MATQATTVQITMPAMGESVTEGTVLDWLKQVGDAVTADEPLVEVSTDKVDAEVPSPATGTLVRILVGPDETVQVGAPLGEIEVGERPRDTAAPASPRPRRRRQRRRGGRRRGASSWTWPSPRWATPWPRAPCSSGASRWATPWRWTTSSWRSPPTRWTPSCPRPWRARSARSSCRPTRPWPWAPSCAASRPAREPPRPRPDRWPRPPSPRPRAPAAGAPAPPPGLATPVAARVASAHGVDVSSVRGSGPRGRVTKEDVLAAVQGNGAAAGARPARGRHRRADPRAGGHARPLHGREPLDPHRHELPHAAGGPARRPPQGPEGGRQEALVHAPDRLGDRQGRGRLAGDGPLVRRGGRQAPADRARQPQPRPGGGRGAQGRHPLARGAGDPRRLRARLRRPSPPATTSWWPARATTSSPPTPTRART